MQRIVKNIVVEKEMFHVWANSNFDKYNEWAIYYKNVPFPIPENTED